MDKRNPPKMDSLADHVLNRERTPSEDARLRERLDVIESYLAEMRNSWRLRGLRKYVRRAGDTMTGQLTMTRPLGTDAVIEYRPNVAVQGSAGLAGAEYDAGGDWAGEANIAYDNTQTAYALINFYVGVPSTMLYFRATTANQIPIGSYITGVKVTIERTAQFTGYVRDYSVTLLDGTTPIGSNRAKSTHYPENNPPSTFGTAEYGGEGDTWGCGALLTDILINGGAFGFGLSCYKDTGVSQDIVHVRYVTLTVYYTSAMLWNTGINVSEGAFQIGFGDELGYNAIGFNHLGQIVSYLATGSAPFVLSSETLNDHLNADLLDGLHGSSYSPSNAQYLVLAASGDLSAERILDPDSSLVITDDGAGGSLHIGVNPAYFPGALVVWEDEIITFDDEVIIWQA